ncbi:MAG: zinc-binding alcohol dehydrogenase family protein [Planctomycetales bacterium]|nr:zinc-binding alcohol dehydrogenase family protein [Planctomycetales bacterium]
MKAVQLEQPKSFRYIDVPEPPAPAEGEAVVRVHAVGICGTDYGGYLGKMPFFSYPRIPGHELGVEVAAVGPGVTNVQPGDRCAVEPYINCQQCYSCRRGHTNCCEHHQTLGVHCDGGLRRLFTVPARKLHHAEKLSPAQAALVETLAIGCHAVDRGRAMHGENLLVIGAGPIGLSVIEFAKLAGARTIVMDMNPQRLEFVRERMGVPDTVLAQPGGEEESQLSAMTDGQLCDLVVDATGSHQSMSQALKYCAFAGRLVYVGITQAELQFPHAPIMHRRELTLLASRNALSRDFTRIIELIGAGRIDTQPWITHRAPFNDMLGQFEGWLNPASGVIKAVVELD